MAMVSMFRSRSVGCWLASLLLLSTLGCQQRMAANLLGEWVGRPDTAEARAEREAEKFGDRRSGDTLGRSSEPITDWEQVDVGVRFHFVSPTQLQMSLANDAEPHSGTWRVLETLPTGCEIEVETATGPEQSVEIRRFRLEMDNHEGSLVGFLLTEAGADRQLGALYFRRPQQAQ